MLLFLDLYFFFISFLYLLPEFCILKGSVLPGETHLHICLQLPWVWLSAEYMPSRGVPFTCSISYLSAWWAPEAWKHGTLDSLLHRLLLPHFLCPQQILLPSTRCLNNSFSFSYVNSFNKTCRFYWKCSQFHLFCITTDAVWFSHPHFSPGLLQ